MKKHLLLFILILLFLNVSSTAYAVSSNCSDCHHIDFQTDKIDRSATCSYCHNPAGGAHPHFVTATSVDADFNTLHNIDHKGASTAAEADGGTCLACHKSHTETGALFNKKIYCKSCHNNVAHENHGNVSASGRYTHYDFPEQASVVNRVFYKTRTFSCINSNCHGTYGALVTKPKCTNCHTDPHGSFPGPNDEAGVKVSPNATNPSTHSDMGVKWLYQLGDTLKKSLDGITWDSLTLTGPSPGSYYTHTDTGILNWTIVYYKIIRSDGSERYFPVYPPGSNAHTNYLDNTQLCASCHITHSAEQSKLLKEQTTEDLCRTCHGLANTGSRYNVDTGEIVVAGSINGSGLITATSYKRANSGAFGILSGGKYYAGNHSETWNGTEVTSTHSTNSLTSGIAPGGGHNDITLTCTSCHLSHPKKNAYRLLTIGTVEAYAVNSSATDERVNYIKNFNTGCGCHRQYINPQNSGHVSSIVYFRHSSGVAIQGPYASVNPITNSPWALSTSLPTEYMVYYSNAYQVAGNLTGTSPTQYVENGAVFCLSCHYAHGSISVGNSPSAYDLNGDSSLNDSSTMLKRLNYDGICQNCHQR